MEEKNYMFFDMESLDFSLRVLERAGYKALCLPELAEVKGKAVNLFVKEGWGRSMSSYIVGRTNVTNHQPNGSAVGIYVHTDDGEWADREYISARIRDDKLINGGLPISQQAFKSLVTRDGEENKEGIKIVSVIPHNSSRKYNVGSYNLRSNPINRDIGGVQEALQNPHVIPFFGSEKGARNYLERMRHCYESINLFLNDYICETPLAFPLTLRGLHTGLIDVDNNFLTTCTDFREKRILARRLESISEEKGDPLGIERTIEESRRFIAPERIDEFRNHLMRIMKRSGPMNLPPLEREDPTDRHFFN